MRSLPLTFKLFLREAILLSRQAQSIVNSSLVYLMIMVFFPLTLPPEEGILHSLAPGMLWIAILMSMIISADRLFQRDYDEGILEQWMVSGISLTKLISIKLWVHWLFNILPILLLLPLITLLFHFSLSEMTAAGLTIALGSPTLFYLAGLASVFSGGLNQRGLFMALILLPLSLPIMIFASGALHLSALGISIKGHLALLGAFSVLAIGLLPYAIAQMMRISLVD